MGELDDAARWLERVTGDPMADAVRGRARVTDASPPAGRGRHQECRVTLEVEADGVSARAVEQVVVLDRRYWPVVGTALPARVSLSHPDAVEVDWDALGR
ncbi:hypothetical protein AB1K54_17060 [Microbacterium sp. BWT-B31]|uniref:hypothetical protein n=1 Tax=Microbacterium sp. BWT-B31 TaxID=3232072 RepID=UPI0035285A63